MWLPEYINLSSGRVCSRGGKDNHSHDDRRTRIRKVSDIYHHVLPQKSTIHHLPLQISQYPLPQLPNENREREFHKQKSEWKVPYGHGLVNRNRNTNTGIDWIYDSRSNFRFRYRGWAARGMTDESQKLICKDIRRCLFSALSPIDSRWLPSTCCGYGDKVPRC